MFGTICKVSQNKSFINKFGGKLSKKIEKATIFVTFDVVVSDTSDGQSDLQKALFKAHPTSTALKDINFLSPDAFSELQTFI